MNILFLCSQEIIPENGGVERVTSILANYFESKGITVYFLSRYNKGSNDKRQLHLPIETDYECYENEKYLYQIIEKKQIDILINQGALLADVSQFSFHARSKGVKIVSVIHNSLLSIAENYIEVYYSILKKRHLLWLVPILKQNITKKVIRRLYIVKKKPQYLNLVKYSDVVSVLSPSFLNELKLITGVASNKVIAIPNPVIVPQEQSIKKENLILYVGRINTTQKRVDTLIRIWQNVIPHLNNWRLIIVGDGPDLDNLKKIVSLQSIPNIIFEGVQDPTPYYQKSKIFCLTSSFEGLPMTILECMSYGVVPILFDSFSAASTIISSKNGVLIKPFDEILYEKKLIELATNKNKLQKMAENARQTINKYSLEYIGAIWIKLFQNIL